MDLNSENEPNISKKVIVTKIKKNNHKIFIVKYIKSQYQQKPLTLESGVRKSSRDHFFRIPRAKLGYEPQF